ncbi:MULTISPECIES: hypothetical protein [unclassified Methylobacterium]|uniref:hypothetical protein n=1 Tax=unclassified Methylobacterium TaxID=2615210 RepID=UPI0011C1F7FC|nr:MULTISPECIES: hypothetical protein [unclassified Methylobacterium]QEE37961.1 hypothetical protein FVA80_02250 [Methylobacterium sp. WL1]TXN59801.1 hypothetical protein FV241_00080 [Methylobacterium sp. WL2]
MTIPEIAARLRAKSQEDGDSELASLADELRRRAPVRRAPITSRRMTPQLRGDIRRYASDNPTIPYAEIGRHFGVNGGRVSETLAGFRE